MMRRPVGWETGGECFINLDVMEPMPQEAQHIYSTYDFMRAKALGDLVAWYAPYA